MAWPADVSLAGPCLPFSFSRANNDHQLTTPSNKVNKISCLYSASFSKFHSSFRILRFFCKFKNNVQKKDRTLPWSRPFHGTLQNNVQFQRKFVIDLNPKTITLASSGPWASGRNCAIYLTFLRHLPYFRYIWKV